MTWVASTSETVGAELSAREGFGAIAPRSCASTLAPAIVQMSTMTLSITLCGGAKGAPASELFSMKRGYSQATTLVCSGLMAIVTRHGFDACATCTS